MIEITTPEAARAMARVRLYLAAIVAACLIATACMAQEADAASPAAMHAVAARSQPAATQRAARRHPHGVVVRRRIAAPMELRTTSQILAEAARYLGARKFTRLPGPWCRDFVNHVAQRAGYRLANRSRRAIDALSLGARVAIPQHGDLVVMRGHVTFFAGWGGRGVLGLGGNQSGGRVTVSSYPAARVVAFVRL